MARSDPTTPRGDEYSARIRAAAAFADIDRVRLGDALGISKESVSALFAGQKRSDQELRTRIAKVCGVPAWFLEHGFSAPPLPDEPTLAERVEAIESRLSTVLNELRDRPVDPPAPGA